MWWLPSLGVTHGPGEEVLQQEVLVAGVTAGAKKGLAPLAARELEEPLEAQEERVSLVEEEHPYWAAVRKAREEVLRYQIDEPAKEAAIRARIHGTLVEPPTWLRNEDLAAMLTRVSKEADVPIVVTGDAASASASMELAWLHRPGKIHLTDWLALTLGLLGGS